MPKTTNRPSKATKNKAVNNRMIRVRMYRVGFGDCFLLSLPADNNEAQNKRFHILVDCGVHGSGNIGTIEQAVDHIFLETSGRLDVIIATHSHQDHISGFSEKFRQFEIGEVWMPWADNPQDKLAIKWSRKQAALAAQLEEHFAAQEKNGDTAASTPRRSAAAAAISNLTRNKNAMQFLRTGFGVGAEVKYLEAGKELKDPAGISGLTVKVLGPPRDEKFLAKMDPPEDQRYLRLDSLGAVGEANRLEPFPSKWHTTVDQMLPNAPRLDKADEKKLEKSLADPSLDSLAFALDHAKNNTSLVTLFIYRGQYLLFPGDAQYGNWKHWLGGEDADDILSRVSFLKVAHHGSHNATPRDALERMTPGGFAAMVATQSVPWDSIPRVPLMKRLDEQTNHKVVRSDWINVPNAPSPLPNSAPDAPTALPEGFTQGAFWYDYEIPVT